MQAHARMHLSPLAAIQLVQLLYFQDYATPLFDGSKGKDIELTAGIRQGCPLSPLLFAMATDLMLRRLRRCFPSSCSRAWADDLAMVIPEAEPHLHALQNLFLDFGRVLGLHLNISKIVLM